MTSANIVRVIDDSGHGPVVVSLRGTAPTPSRTAPLLAKEFRVVSIAVDSAAGAGEAAAALAAQLASLNVTEAGLIADAAVTPVALALAIAHPQMVQSVALLSPAAVNGADIGNTADLKAPILALFGTNDTARAPDAPKAFCRSLPNCRLVYVYDADRAVDDERPEAVAAALQDFAVRREGYLVNGKLGNLYP